MASTRESKEDLRRRYEEHCRRHGLRLTIQKRIVLEALLDLEGHPTVDEIHASVSANEPGVSRVTVYRILEGLAAAGAANKVLHAGSTIRYEPNIERHHHLVCVECGDVSDLTAPDLDDLPLPRTDDGGFEVFDYSVHFRGRCSRCREGAST